MRTSLALSVLRPLLTKNGAGASYQRNTLKYQQQLARTLTTKSLSKSLELSTNSNEIKIDGYKVQLKEERPLTVLMVWLMSQKKHVQKYSKFYLDQGFDVLTVRCTPWQLLWPSKGSHIVGRDVAKFLAQNEIYHKTVLHGFSVGCYVWGEVLHIMSQDLTKYTPAMNRIKAQIWDSSVDYGEIPIGVPKSIFPTNSFLRTCLEKYSIFHMKTFQESATKHHLKATDQFFNSIVTAPAMFLFSLNDPMVNLKSIERCRGIWQGKGMKVYLRAWEMSPHVGILQRHPEEYTEEIKTFIDKQIYSKGNDMTAEKFRVKNELLQLKNISNVNCNFILM